MTSPCDHIRKVLTSIPEIGVRTKARLLIELADGSTFPTAGHLAAYAGLAPPPAGRALHLRGVAGCLGEGTSSPNGPYPSPCSRPWVTPQHRGPTMTRNSAGVRTKARPSVISPTLLTCFPRCSETTSSTHRSPDVAF
ncbi:transposase [Streptomyces sp. NPDC002952]|uniref:transposase n=1 Tax=Streptomyces sp. NPDC002952 TaxID=3364673 RepID=UPI0036BCE4C1